MRKMKINVNLTIIFVGITISVISDLFLGNSSAANNGCLLLFIMFFTVAEFKENRKYVNDHIEELVKLIEIRFNVEIEEKINEEVDKLDNLEVKEAMEKDLN